MADQDKPGLAAFVRLPDDVTEVVKQLARERGVTVSELLRQVSAPKPKASAHQLSCSFCGKSQREVKKLIAGPTVYICDECVTLSLQIIVENDGSPPPLEDWATTFSGQAACGFAFEMGMGAIPESTTRCMHCRAQWRTSDEAARAHLLVCSEHPMRAVERERDELREGLRRMALQLPERRRRG